VVLESLWSFRFCLDKSTSPASGGFACTGLRHPSVAAIAMYISCVHACVCDGHNLNNLVDNTTVWSITQDHIKPHIVTACRNVVTLVL